MFGCLVKMINVRSNITLWGAFPKREKSLGGLLYDGLAKRTFAIVGETVAMTAFPPAGGFAVAVVLGLSDGLLNSDAECPAGT
jgi:hypothetical protein